MTVTTKEYVDEQCMNESSNAAWVPCILDGGSNSDSFKVLEDVQNTGSADFYLRWTLPLPTVRGDKQLIVDAVRVLLAGADSNDYLNMIKVLGLTYLGVTALYQNQGDWKSQAKVEYDFSNKACGNVDMVVVTLHIVATSGTDLKIRGVLLKCFYD